MLLRPGGWNWGFPPAPSVDQRLPAQSREGAGGLPEGCLGPEVARGSEEPKASRDEPATDLDRPPLPPSQTPLEMTLDPQLACGQLSPGANSEEYQETKALTSLILLSKADGSRPQVRNEGGLVIAPPLEANPNQPRRLAGVHRRIVFETFLSLPSPDSETRALAKDALPRQDPAQQAWPRPALVPPGLRAFARGRGCERASVQPNRLVWPAWPLCVWLSGTPCLAPAASLCVVGLAGSHWQLYPAGRGLGVSAVAVLPSRSAPAWPEHGPSPARTLHRAAPRGGVQDSLLQNAVCLKRCGQGVEQLDGGPGDPGGTRRPAPALLHTLMAQSWPTAAHGPRCSSPRRGQERATGVSEPRPMPAPATPLRPSVARRAHRGRSG